MEPTESEIEAIKGKYPGAKLLQLRNEFGVVILRIPNLGEYQRYLNEIHSAATKGVAGRNLLVSSAVFPSDAQFRALLEGRPGLVTSFSNDLLEAAGTNIENEKKEL